jgi:AraC-like DNA-binding protein
MISTFRHLVAIFLVLTSLPSYSQSIYLSKLQEVAKTIESAPVRADSVIKVIVSEATMQQPGGMDSVLTYAYALLGHCHLYQGKLNLALYYYNKSLYENRSYIFPKQYMGCTSNIAVILENQYRFKEAAEIYQNVLKYAQGAGDSSLITDAWLNIGNLNHKLKDDDTAVEIMEKLATYYRQKRDTLRMAIVLQNIGTCYYPAHLDKAEKYTRESLELYYRLGIPYYVSREVNNLAEILVLRKKYDEARRLLQDNTQFCETNGLSESCAVAYRLWAHCEIEANGNLQNAREYIEKSQKHLSQSGRSDILRDLKETELLLQVRSGNFGEVKKILESYKLLYDESARENARIINSEFQTIYEVNKISEQKRQLQLGMEVRNKQLVTSLVALLAAVLAIVIIVMQYLRLRQVLKTMYRMNLEIANSSPAYPAHFETFVNENTDGDEEVDDDNISMINLYSTILERFESQKLYLDPTLSIQSLGESMNRNPRYISKAIKEVGNTNFSTLVNRFRINEARRLLASSQDIPVNDVMLQSGFGSKQSFHRNFKMATGFTPAEYLERAKKSNSANIDIPDNNLSDSDPE